MKRMTALLLCLCLMLSGCRPTESDPLLAVDPAASADEKPVSSAAEETPTETEPPADDADDTPETAIVEETLSIPAIPPTQTDSAESPSAESDHSDYEGIALEEVEEPEELPKLRQEVRSVSAHPALAEDLYYQYSFLSEAEKKVYAEVVQAMKNGETLLDLSAYACSVDSVTTVFTAVRSDYPQFFYLGTSFGYTDSARKNTVKQLIIFYFDGETEDQYSETGELTASADRSLIDRQIQAFNLKVSEIIGKIPANASDLEKEKWIYDYLQDTIVYNSDAAAAIANGLDVDCHAFDAYGAACEGLAVCEGYAELFQYLCYCVNINATPVYGTVLGGYHQWDAVCLDSEWYMVDATWDDAETDGLHCYGYFNITDAEIRADHTIDDETAHVPPCSATAYAFYNWYALYIASPTENPANYERVIDDLAKKKENYLCVYIGNLSGSKRGYMQQYILSSRSDLQQYIISKEYHLSFYSTYYTIGNYCYIPLKTA